MGVDCAGSGNGTVHKVYRLVAARAAAKQGA